MRSHQNGAAPLSVLQGASGSAGKMGWIRVVDLPPNRLNCRPAARLCRSYYFRPPPAHPVDDRYRTAAIGTQNAY
jgi:hypothetical protein